MNLTAYFDRFQIDMTHEDMLAMSASGNVTHMVKFLCTAIERPPAATPSAVAAELRDYGAWEEEQLANDADNWERICWIAAGNIKQELSIKELSRLRS